MLINIVTISITTIQESNTLIIPPPIEFHLPTVGSTNDYAKELLGTYPYVFVSAMHQTAGRGRKGRGWEGDYGLNAYCSLGVQHTGAQGIEDLSAYMARGSLAVLAGIRSIAPLHTFRLKYPNDVQAWTKEGWRKISGVLVEHEFLGDRCISTVVGIGVNVQQVHFSETISAIGTSLYLLGVRANVLTVIEKVRTNIIELRMRPWDEVHAEWERELAIVGKRIGLAGDEGVWQVMNVLADGRLLVRKEHSIHERVISDGDTVQYHD